MKIKGKNGQERKDGKKTGGVMFNIDIPQHAVDKIVAAILKDEGKLAQMMFAYGLTAQAQEEIGYTIPGSVPWEEGKEAAVYQWKDVDTEDYVEALETYRNLPIQRTGLTLEARQEAWDKKKALLDKSQETLPEEFRMTAEMIASILGKRPEKK